MKKNILGILLCIAVQAYATAEMSDAKLASLEQEAKRTVQDFQTFSKNLNIVTASESIVSQDEVMLKKALQDIIDLNKMVNSHVNVAIQFWNEYLNNVRLPSMESYLLGQVMNSLIGTMRALTMRSSMDQAMILSFVKKQSQQHEAQKNEPSMAIEAPYAAIEERWKLLHID